MIQLKENIHPSLRPILAADGQHLVKTIGWGPWRKDWYSICSTHKNNKADCIRCNAGHWTNHWQWWFGHMIYTLAPDLWRWWVNRKHGF